MAKGRNKKGFGKSQQLKNQEILKQKAMLKSKMLNESVDQRNLRYNIIKAIIESNKLSWWQSFDADNCIVEAEKILDWLEAPVESVNERFEEFAKEFDKKLKQQDIIDVKEAEEVTEEAGKEIPITGNASPKKGT